MVFKDRRDAGKQLAQLLTKQRENHPLIIALSKGGVVIGSEIAKTLKADLDLLVVKKIGIPEAPEYIIGAVTEQGHYYLNDAALSKAGLTPKDINPLIQQKQESILEKVLLYRNHRELSPISHRDVIVVDDGLASGSSARVSLEYLKSFHPHQLTLAVPVCPGRTIPLLTPYCDELVSLIQPQDLQPSSEYYGDYFQVTDQQVRLILNSFRKMKSTQPSRLSLTPQKKVSIPLGQSIEIQIHDHHIQLPGLLHIPKLCYGIAIFSHGSGSSRLSPRNQKVASQLNAQGIGTLLFDLLTPQESNQSKNVFDIPLLGSRLLLSVNWIKNQPLIQDMPLGLFAASTGAAAALWAAAVLKDEINAVVSRGGRPDLAMSSLSEVVAPVLLIVGQKDAPVIELNQKAMQNLPQSKLIVIPQASHLFEEPGTLEQVAQEAVSWLNHNFLDAHEKTVQKKRA